MRCALGSSRKLFALPVEGFFMRWPCATKNLGFVMKITQGLTGPQQTEVCDVTRLYITDSNEATQVGIERRSHYSFKSLVPSSLFSPSISNITALKDCQSHLVQNKVVPCRDIFTSITITVSAMSVPSQRVQVTAHHIVGCEQHPTPLQSSRKLSQKWHALVQTESLNFIEPSLVKLLQKSNCEII